MSTAGGQHTTAGTVKRFADRLGEYFNGWDELSRGMSWEMIIYIQHADSKPMNGWRDVMSSISRTRARRKNKSRCSGKKGTPVPSVNIERSNERGEALRSEE
ncbi:putative retrotransposon hot spot (RHS) protein [Trypanosoma cruzi]|nr:putative retrotransposon hot spot (RHS) protein [Trypanosoma cruzi]